MLGQMGQIANLLKNAGKIKEGMAEMNARLEAARYVGEAGGGQARATVNGRGDVVEIKFDPAVIQAGDVEMVEDLTLAAIRDGTSKSREAMQKEMESLGGGLGLPNMDKLMGGEMGP